MRVAERRRTMPATAPGGLTAWLVRWLRSRFRPGERPCPRLALVERIALAPRQTLTLVEAEGRRFLVATSTEGAAAFYPLDDSKGRALTPPRRVSW